MKFTRSSLRYSVNEKFFDVWTSQMAYVLGFTYADGNIYKTSLAWDIQTRDVDVLRKIKKAMRSTYPIIERRHSVRFRMSNQMLILGAVKRGLLPKKNIRNQIPKIPKKLMRHFVRGYLEGDGWICIRSGREEVDIGFANGNKVFLCLLSNVLVGFLNIKGGRVRKKIKITPKGKVAITYQLEFYSSNAIKIARWLYRNLDRSDIRLDRKYKKYLRANKLYTFWESGPRRYRVVQRKFGKPMRDILGSLYNEQRLNGTEIAKVLHVHSSSVYRWLARTGIKYPIPRKVIYG